MEHSVSPSKLSKLNGFRTAPSDTACPSRQYAARSAKRDEQRPTEYPSFGRFKSRMDPNLLSGNSTRQLVRVAVVFCTLYTGL